jgi:acetyl-CoA carboxylase biotin carboxylase subunit
VRNDNGVYGGYTVPLFYDPMLSKLICHAATRPDAIARMRRALMEYRVEGIQTTIPFFMFIMENPDFAAANFDTGFIDRLLGEMNLEHRDGNGSADAAVVAASIAAFEETQQVRLPETDGGTRSAWKWADR